MATILLVFIFLARFLAHPLAHPLSQVIIFLVADQILQVISLVSLRYIVGVLEFGRKESHAQ